MTTVILAEKPSQARAYVDSFAKSKKCEGYYCVSDSILPTDTVVTYAFGHLVELATPDKYNPKYKRWSMNNLPIFPETFKYIVPHAKSKQFKIVASLLQAADTIVIATDSDREGENIAWSIMRQAKINVQSKDLKRLWINSLEKSAIREGFINLQNGWDYFNRYKEAQTRQLSDWLVGMNASPLFSLSLRKNGINGVYSIGRVQTPTLYMVYKRDREIADFVSEPYFEINGNFWSNRKKFSGKLEPYRKFKTPAEVTIFLNKNQTALGKQKGIVLKIDKKTKRMNSPRLFSLSSLQSEANKLFHSSASSVLSAVQNLYESKFLSYPRTDCNFITEKEYAYLRENLNKYLKRINNLDEFKEQLGSLNSSKRYVDGKKVQEHHAIILTKTIPTVAQYNQMSNLEKNIYDLVFKTTMAMFLKPYEYETVSALIKVKNLKFKATGSTPKNKGWKILFSQKGKTTALPVLCEGQEITANLLSEQKMTVPPASFTEGTLITAMKTAGKTLNDEEAAILKGVEGIGTEATRANIIDVLKKRDYLKLSKNKLSVTEQGTILCEAAEAEPLLVSPSMTAKWEKALTQVGQGKRSQSNFIGQIERFILKMIKEVPYKISSDERFSDRTFNKQNISKEKSIGSCPICKNGQILDYGKFYGCSNYKRGCEFSLPKKFAGKSIGKRIVKTLIIKGRTDNLDGFKSKKTGKTYSAKLKLDGNKLSLLFE